MLYWRTVSGSRLIPDQSVGGSGIAGLLQDLAGPAPVPDDGPHEDQAGHLLGVSLGVARGEQAPHGVPGEDDRQAGMLGGGDAGQGGQVVHDVLEVDDQRPFAVAVPVAQVVLGVDRRPGRRQDLTHVGVAGGVLGVPVDDDHDPVRGGARLPGPVEDGALAPGEGGFPADHVASWGDKVARSRFSPLRRCRVSLALGRGVCRAFRARCVPRPQGEVAPRSPRPQGRD